MPSNCRHIYLKLKLKYLRGSFWRSQSLRFSLPHAAKLWHYATELRTLSVTYPLISSALTNTTDNPSEMWPQKLLNFCLFLYNQSYTILQGPLIPPMAFTSCNDQGYSHLSESKAPIFPKNLRLQSFRHF